MNSPIIDKNFQLLKLILERKRKIKRTKKNSITKKKILILLGLFFLNIGLYKDLFINIYKYKRLLFLRPSNRFCIIIIIGTRTDVLKMIPIIKELKNNNKFFCITVNIGSHQKMTKQILKSLNMNKYIDIELNVMRKNQILSKLTSKITLELDKIYSSFNPDSVIVQGDTTTSFTTALSAFYKKIPIFHIESGFKTKDLYSSFSEEFNRIAIHNISTLLFTPNKISAINLLKEDKNKNKIFVTGSTIVETLTLILNKTYPSKYINDLIKNAKSFYKNNIECKIILLACHRGESYFYPIINIIKAIQKLLKDFENIVIIFPILLAPNDIQSIKNEITEAIYNDLINKKEIKDPLYSYFNRLFLIKPLNYIDFIHLLSESYFIITDSNETQEESLSIGKPVLFLGENTERNEGVKLTSTILTGIHFANIYNYSSLLLNNETLYNEISKIDNNVYGSRNPSNIIINIIERYFENRLSDSNYSYKFNDLNYSEILFKYDNLLSKSNNEVQYDIVIVLTVWKRNNLERQLMQVKRQSIIDPKANKKINIIIFQNSNHVNITDIIKKWNMPNIFSDNVKITYINPHFETGYFGRFLSPFTSPVTPNAIFIICDDDVIWGDRYFENMIRVVEEGFFATRTGRLIDQRYNEILPNSHLFWRLNAHACFDEDIEYDFGGHMWAGKISWLRKAWTHIPVAIENCEDFWISTTLKTFYNISTKIPKCPCPEEGKVINPDFCAASDKTAGHHINSIIGKRQTKDPTLRTKIMQWTYEKYNYTPLLALDPNTIGKIKSKFKYGNETNPLFNLSDHLWDDILFWQ